MVASGVRDRLYLRETYVWYELALAAVPERELPDGMELVRATEADLWLAEQTGKGSHSASDYLRQGHDLWVVREGDVAAFSCWTYRGWAPIAAVPHGRFELPPGVACLENSVTNPEFRGRGVAPGAWDGMAKVLREEGVEALVTKVRVENAPSRRACIKAGFDEVAEMTLSQTGPRSAVTFSYASTPGARAIEERLAH
jgi:RimJ/RimL family protein N-acetyltransferase